MQEYPLQEEKTKLILNVLFLNNIMLLVLQKSEWKFVYHKAQNKFTINAKFLLFLLYRQLFRF